MTDKPQTPDSTIPHRLAIGFTDIRVSFQETDTYSHQKFKKMSIVGNEFNFSREVDNFNDEVRDSGIEISVSAVRELKPEDAQLVLLRNYAEIEEMIDRWFRENDPTIAIRSRNGKPVRPVSMRAKLLSLSKNNILDEEIISLVGRLRELRNIAAHSTDFRVHAGEAFDFIAASEGLKSRIKEALGSGANRTNS